MAHIMISEKRQLTGIHHVTAIAGDPQENVDFYSGILALRFIKLTVNFDDPSAYHLYFGDEIGNPGTILTFFSWPGAQRGRRGSGQAVACSFSVPEGSLDYWMDRLAAHAVNFDAPRNRLAEEFIALKDPDGLQLELVAHAGADARSGWAQGSVPGAFTIRGVHGVTLNERYPERTARYLQDILKFRNAGESPDVFRMETGDGGAGTIVNIQKSSADPMGLVAVGSIHHVAWRTPDDQGQNSWRDDLLGCGINVTPIVDRQYFRSIYFREPGGVLFEIATDLPGFLVDETKEELGMQLRLPPWHEERRAIIERSLPPIRSRPLVKTP